MVVNPLMGLLSDVRLPELDFTECERTVRLAERPGGRASCQHRRRLTSDWVADDG